MLDRIEIDMLEPVLSDRLFRAVAKGHFKRVFLALSSDGEDLDARVNLKTEVAWQITIAKKNEGMIGETLSTGQLQEWSLGDKSAFKKGDSRTVRAFSIPVRIGEEVVGALLFDFFKNENVRIAQFKSNAFGLVQDLEEILNQRNQGNAKLKRKVFELTDGCLRDSRSLRGYTAIRFWDGSVEYFPVGSNTDVFKDLSFEEGLSGEAYQTRATINIGDVWQHPKYISSDDEIRSEFVVPLIDAGDCNGVLNMESPRSDFFKEHERKEIVEDYAKQITEVANEIIAAHSSSTPRTLLSVSFLTSSVCGSEGPVEAFHSVSSIQRWLLNNLKQAISMLEPSIVSVSLEEDLKIVRDKYSQLKSYAPVKRLQRGFVHTEFYLINEGRVQAVVTVKSRGTLGRTVEGTIQYLCRFIASEFRRRKSVFQEEKLSAIVKKTLKFECLEQVLSGCLYDIRDYLNADTGTSFIVRELEDDGVLFPLASTSEVKYSHGERRFYYIDPEDGLTGAAACEKGVTIFENISEYVKGAPSNYGNPKYLAKITDGSDVELRSVLTLSLWRNGDPFGLIRLHRTVEGRNSSFLADDRIKAEQLYHLIDKN